VWQFYREMAEVSDDVKCDGSAADSKSTSPDTAAAASDELIPVPDISDVDMKTEEGFLLTHLHYCLRY